MKASELAAALATLPAAWAAVLPGWTPERLLAVQAAVVAVSGDAPIAPDDPLRAASQRDFGQVEVIAKASRQSEHRTKKGKPVFETGRAKKKSSMSIEDDIAFL